MSSSVELPKTQIAQRDKTLSADLQVVFPTAAKSTATHFRRGILACEVFADLLTITLAIKFGYVVYVTAGIGKHTHFSSRVIWTAAGIFSAVLVLMLDRVGAYRRGNSLLRVRETEQVLRVSAGAFLMVFAVSFFTNFLFSRWLLVLCLNLVPLLLFLQKNVVYSLIRILHSRGYGNEKVLIYGSGYTG